MRIETERLILRPFTVKDAEDLFSYLRDISINCFASMKVTTLEEAKKQAEERSKDPELYFAIEHKNSGKVIGEICSHAEGTAPGNESARDTFSPCWMLHTDYQGKGYMYEAANAYYDYLFNKKMARRIYIYTEDYNIACQKLSERLGMRKEGLFREFVSFVNDAEGNPVYENTYQYAILKKEWEYR